MDWYCTFENKTNPLGIGQPALHLGHNRSTLPHWTNRWWYRKQVKSFCLWRKCLYLKLWRCKVFQRLFDKDVFANIAEVSFPISNPAFVCLFFLFHLSSKISCSIVSRNLGKMWINGWKELTENRFWKFRLRFAGFIIRGGENRKKNGSPCCQLNATTDIPLSGDFREMGGAAAIDLCLLSRSTLYRSMEDASAW